MSDLDLKKAWDNVLARAETARRTFHEARHSFASMFLNDGRQSQYLLKELLGQSDISTTEIYSHAKQEALAAAVNALEFDDTEQPGGMPAMKLFTWSSGCTSGCSGQKEGVTNA
ncbi:MAG: tyrosine-type recombinase/integrase [Myxococcales bacterium]|nr:tyrosine-type recombinase/integrase [Myxococcales bacterium]